MSFFGVHVGGLCVCVDACIAMRRDVLMRDGIPEDDLCGLMLG